jgi:Fe-S oxidoreductase
MATQTPREGSLEAPTRHPLDWKAASFWSHDKLFQELERVFEICHGCRRCVSLCNAFPTLFDLVDESDTMEVDGVAKEEYWKVVEHCYLCDLCYMTKCPYVPPHEWNVDFPHLMLRAKAVHHREQAPSFRDRLLSSTDALGKINALPVIAPTVNAVNRNATLRKVLHKVLGVHEEATLPPYSSKTFRRSFDDRGNPPEATPAGPTQGRVALFATCYCNYNEPGINEDLVAVFQHNGIPVALTRQEQCCGMPKLELGDLDAVARAKEVNVPELARLVDEGWDLTAPVPSCVLMFKKELPLLFPDDAQVQKVAAAFYDPFEYLMLRHRHELLKTDFKHGLGKISYHAPCHQRVQNIGPKTRDALALVPDTEVELIERCSGHDGTYAVKVEFHAMSMKIGKPVARRVQEAAPAHYSSDCPMAGNQIGNGLRDGTAPVHPLSLLRQAYGL